MSRPSPSSVTPPIESLDSDFSSPSLPSTRQHIRFPPAQRVDFIVHFGQTDFHCHTFVLHIQSTYFRHVFDALTPSTTSPLPPPPSLPNLLDSAASDDTRATIDLSPVSSPTSSPSSPQQPVWRSLLSSATSDVQCTVQPPTYSRRGMHIGKRDTREEEEENDEKRKSEESNITKRQALSTPSPADPASASSSTAASTPSPCNHLGLQCVHIPPQRTVISGEQITEADFELFLRHLYFCSHYRFPPFLPATDIHLTATAPPAVTLPPYPELTEQMTSDLLRTRTPAAATSTVKLVWKEATLTLAQYFDCTALLARCEAVGMRRLERVRHAGAYFDVLYAHQYGMREWKRRCIELILTDKRMKQRKEYRLSEWWERKLLLDMVGAANSRLQVDGSGKEEEQKSDRSNLMRLLERAVVRGLSEV